MSKHTICRPDPVYRHTLESIEAHLSIFFAALVVSHWLEHQTGWSIKQFVLTERRHRTAQIEGRPSRPSSLPTLNPNYAKINSAVRGLSGYEYSPRRAVPLMS